MHNPLFYAISSIRFVFRNFSQNLGSITFRHEISACGAEMIPTFICYFLGMRESSPSATVCRPIPLPEMVQEWVVVQSKASCKFRMAMLTF